MASERILVIDDNPANLKLVRIVLEDAGYQVDLADSAESAEQVLTRTRPRVVLMDLQLPGTDGFELTARLRADDSYDDTWIIAVTACAMPRDRERALHAGCDDFLTKPLDLEAFGRRVAACFGAARRA